MAIDAGNAGDLVLATYKSGQYIAELIEWTPPRAVVKILAVVKHPEQGDLHHPQEVEVPLFHQRRALAYQEKAVVPIGQLQPYAGEVPDYRESLQQALLQEMRLAEKRIAFWQRSLQELTQLRQDYFGE
ncbi:sporulation phosphorelay system protein KapB [Brevibacillus fulvus]|uniref:Kinase-associated protein B n=1 Tax=Brevibacillus fulvus TaxID=1125967 RepID=A0A939BQZ4_9BACL|nr:sporulation phosphorelay system protein KapB [Brevibacillus fulvus]MBM7589052.1 kinase-associated protein B [Brevibacillus fulvus]